jgi:hypothetical protein
MEARRRATGVGQSGQDRFLRCKTRTAPLTVGRRRYQPDDTLLAFLEAL